MKSNLLTMTLVTLLTTALVAPPIFIIASPKTYAAGLPVFDAVVAQATESTFFETVIDVIQNTISAVKSVLIAANTYISSVANHAQYIYTYILLPLGFILSGRMLKSMTVSVVAFVNGQANGTGIPQYVQNVNGLMQQVGDKQASVFLSQLSRSPNSPFAASIASSLRTNYLQQTSAAGFFAANQSTLHRASPNVNAFLNGDWSKGGVRAWFALTTQPQNNPYMLYQASQNQLGTLVATAQSATTRALDWGQGFLSWCGTSDGTESFDEDGNSLGISGPLPNCTQADGSPGSIKTPGSTIGATLNKVLGSSQDKLVQMGQLALEVNSILGNIGTVMNTADAASQILGGASSQGLFGATATYQSNSRDFLGVSNATVYQNVANSPLISSDILNRAAQYESSWNTIATPVRAAAVNVTDLANFCTAAADAAAAMPPDATGTVPPYVTSFISTSRAEALSARSAFATYVSPALTRVATASTTVAAARAMVRKVQTELNSGSEGAPGAYLADIQALQTMAPTTLDAANAEQDAMSFNQAVASPPGSLTVSGGTLIDRMNLLSTNSVARKTSMCILPPPPPPPSGSSGSGASSSGISGGDGSL